MRLRGRERRAKDELGSEIGAGLGTGAVFQVGVTEVLVQECDSIKYFFMVFSSFVW